MFKEGYFIVPRGLFRPEHNLSPIAKALFFWMLENASWKDGDRIRRGQLLTTINKMREALAFNVGFRPQLPTIDQIRGSYEALMKAGMITVMKTIRGIIVTIHNYSEIQDYKNYEARTEDHSENSAKPLRSPFDIGTTELQNKISPSTSAVDGDYDDDDPYPPQWVCDECEEGCAANVRDKICPYDNVLNPFVKGLGRALQYFKNHNLPIEMEEAEAKRWFFGTILTEDDAERFSDALMNLRQMQKETPNLTISFDYFLKNWKFYDVGWPDEPQTHATQDSRSDFSAGEQPGLDLTGCMEMPDQPHSNIPCLTQGAPGGDVFNIKHISN